ncbi:MAG: cache domain-containing protein, partial [bacterium]
MKKQIPYKVLLIFLFLIAGISIGGYFYFRYAKQSYRIEIDHQLCVIAELKVKQIVEWRRERLTDASLFYKNDLFSGLVQNYFKNPHDPVSSKHIRELLLKIKQYHDYENIFLIDLHGVNRFSIPTPAAPVSSIISSHVPEIIKSKQIIFEDFYRDETDGQIYLCMCVPIIDVQDSSRVLGMLALQIDPKLYLYPFINTWPTPSRTSEILIVRKEGDDVLFLNDLRFDTNTALALRIPLKRIEVPGVRAALGWQGSFEGIDFNGVPVIAAVRPIPNSPWGMVARMDISEAFAPLKKQLLILAIPSGILLISLF